MEILLVEPNYSNKYPPLGLMKISTYHKNKGDKVFFAKGIHKSIMLRKWDRIYISTLFTFNYGITMKTIKAYKKLLDDPKNLYLGGPMASVMRNELVQDQLCRDITIISGLIDEPGVLGNDDQIVDDLLPDYSIISNITETFNYNYPVKNDFLIHTTHGCIRKCSFCAVPIIEPEFKEYCSIKEKVVRIRDTFGDMRNVMIMDNNILASKNLKQIIHDLVELGFGKENRSFVNEKTGRQLKRFVDFNQGLDARLLSADPLIMKELSKISIRPLRVAFDHASEEFVSKYKTVMYQAAEWGIKSCSNYILFNHDDLPEDLYYRLKVNIDLNIEFKKMGASTEIWSFPMKFSPIFGEDSYNRKHIGKEWNRKYLRALQCILIPTHGVVGPKVEYFNHAFGKDKHEFLEILMLPEEYIINRNLNTKNGNIGELKRNIERLSSEDKEIFFKIILNEDKKFIKRYIEQEMSSKQLKDVLRIYQ